MRRKGINTFSIVAYDPAEQACGVAVASKFLAAAAVVSWAQADAGAVATQSHAKVPFGPDGLALMKQGVSAEETLQRLLADDPQASRRQVGIVDIHGNAAAHTGSECSAWAGHRVGKGYTCQGNILTGGEVLEAMASAYENARGELADRLMAALLAGDLAGGDRRGRQAAGLLVAKPNAGYGGDNDHYLDLRVDDHPEATTRLAEIVRLHHLYFGRPAPDELFTIDHNIAAELQTLLSRLGYYQGEVHGEWDTASQQAFWSFSGVENLEERWSIDGEPNKIDQVTLSFIRERFGEG